MLPRCGRAAHICEANLFLKFVFPAAIACFKTFKFRQSCIMRIKVVSSDKATGQLQTLAGKSRGGTPFCRMRKTVFPKSRIFCKAFPLQLFHWNSCKMSVDCFRETRRGGLVRTASKSCRFSHHPLRVPKGWHRDFAACGQRSGLLSHTSPTFLKNCWIKKLFSCLRLVFGKPFAYGSARLGHIPSLP